MEKQNKYYAFISYNSADEKWANWLQHKIEYYHVPSTLCKEHPELPKKIRPIFWYKKDLSGTKLKQALQHELENSKYLIVVCSPYAAKSEWVNEEVSSFIQQGKGDRIIPFIVDGVPHATNPNDECFPPALRHLSLDEEIRGIDVRRKEGKSHALVDVIATMFGLRFDELWKRHERRKKQMRNWSIAVLSLMILLAVGIYDYTRIHIEYYADYVNRWGVAEGIIPLTKQQVSHRGRSYQFRYRRIPLGQPNAYSWRLASVAYVNSALVPQDEDNDERYAIQQFEYSAESSDLIRINFCTPKGKILLRHNISEHNGKKAAIADLTAASEAKGAAFASSNISNSMSDNNNKSNIKRFAYERNTDGYIIQQTFHSNNDDNLPNSAVSNGDGIFGIHYTIDSLGRPTQSVYLDINGRPFTNRKGVAAKEYVYNTHGNICQTQTIDSRGRLVANENLWAKCTYEFDENDNVISTTFYDAKGKPCVNEFGAARYEYENDKHGNTIELRFYDIDGKLCFSNQGFAKISLQYDRDGNETERSYYGIDGSPCLDINGIAKRTSEYDKRGNLLVYSSFDTEGKPCPNKYGITQYRYRYDEHDNRTEISNYNEKNAPCPDNQGVAKYTYKYDEQGNQIEMSYYDIENQPCVNKEGIAKFIYKYDNRGNLTEEAFFDTEGKACTDKDGISKWVLKHDMQGNTIEISTHGIDGKLCLNQYGEAKQIYKYNQKGNCIEELSYGIDDKPCLNALGYAKVTLEYDDRGNCIEYSYYDINDRPCMNTLEYSQSVQKYDNRGYCTETTYYDIHGRLCKTIDGYAQEIIKYDNFGNLTEKSWFGTDGRPCPIHNTYAKKTFKYDNQSHCIEECFYDIKGNLCSNDKGVSVYHYTYDRLGNVTEKSCYDTNRKPCLDKSGVHKIIRKYNEKSWLLETCLYDEKNKPTEALGYFKKENTYNRDGSIANTIYYNAQKQQVESQIYACLVYAVEGKAKQIGIPANSIIVKWNNWEVGEGEEKFKLEYDKSNFLPKTIICLTPDGYLKEFHIEEVLTGLSIRSSSVSQEQANNALKQL